MTDKIGIRTIPQRKSIPLENADAAPQFLTACKALRYWNRFEEPDAA